MNNVDVVIGAYGKPYQTIVAILSILKYCGRHISKIWLREELHHPFDGVNLYFIKTLGVKYKQFNDNFLPALSILDVIMFNPKDKIKEMLSKYTLI